MVIRVCYVQKFASQKLTTRMYCFLLIAGGRVYFLYWIVIFRSYDAQKMN